MLITPLGHLSFSQEVMLTRLECSFSLCFNISAHIVGQVRQQVPAAHVESHSRALERPEAHEGCVDLLLDPRLQLPQLHAKYIALSRPVIAHQLLLWRKGAMARSIGGQFEHTGTA